MISILDFLLVCLIGALSGLIWVQDRMLRRTLARARMWRALAELNERMIRLGEFQTRLWRDRALHPELRSFWRAIENVVPDDEEKRG